VPTSILAAADKLPDVPGFEDFGPGAGATRSLAPLAPLRTTTPQPLTARTTVEPEDLGSPSGPISASFSNSWLPQGLVRSLEGDVTPHESAFDNADLPFIADGRASSDADSDSDSGGDSPPWQRNPAVQRFIPGTSSPHMGGSTGTLPGTAAGNSNANSLQSSRRWFSTSPSSENVSTGFNLNLFSSHGHVHAPSGVVGSSDSLPLGFESPFAPSASEKRALKWPLLGKARWGSSGNGNGLDEITAGLRETSSTPPLGSSPDPAYNATGLSAEELFNRVPVPVTSASAGWYSSARSYNGIGNSVGNGAGNGGKDNGSVNGQFGLTAAHRHSPPHDSNTDHPAVNAAAAGASTDEVVLEGGGMPGMPAAERKASFRFFSLRKGAAS
jgi:hypothetical protein